MSAIRTSQYCSTNNKQVVAQQLNEAERDAENMNKIFKIQEKLSGDFEVIWADNTHMKFCELIIPLKTLVEPSRRLIKEGALQYYKPKDMDKPQVGHF